MTYYEILRVSEDDSADAIRTAYKTLAKKYHPDVFDGDKKFAEEKMKIINEAYEILSDEKSRIEYDKTFIKKASESTSEKAYQNASANTSSNIDNENANNQDFKQTNDVDEQEYSDKKQKTKPIFCFRYSVVCLILFLSLTLNSIALFVVGIILFVCRFVLNRVKPQFKSKGLKKIITASLFFGLLFGGLCYFCADLSSPTVSTPDNENAFESTTIVLSDDLPNEETTTSIIKDNIINTPKFSSPKIGKDILISSVDYVGKETAVICADDEVLFYNLKTDKGVHPITNPIFVTEVILNDLKFEILQQDYFVDYGLYGSIELIDKYGRKAISSSDGVIVDEVLVDKQQYIGRRSIVENKTAYDELALFSFSGNLLTGWIRLPVRYDNLKYVGSGVYLAYEYSVEHSEKTKCFIIDVLNECINEVEEIQCGEENENYSTILLCDVLLPHETSAAEGYSGDFVVKRMTPFYGNKCIVYLQNQYLLSDRELFFYLVDRNGSVNQISRRTDADHIQYVESIDAIVCVTCNSEQFEIRDMYDNTILYFDDRKISDFELYENYILIEEEVILSDNTSEKYISIFDYSGEMLIDSMNVNDSFNSPSDIDNYSISREMIIDYMTDFFKFLPEIGCYSIITDEKLCVFDLSGKKIYEFSQITATEKKFWGTKKYTYKPRSVTVYDNYYVLWCTKEDDTVEGRYFIGEIEYLKKSNIKIDDVVQESQVKEEIVTKQNVSIDYSVLEGFWGYWNEAGTNWNIELSEKYFSSFSGNGSLNIESCFSDGHSVTALFTFYPYSTGEDVLCKAVLVNDELKLSKVLPSGETFGEMTILERPNNHYISHEDFVEDEVFEDTYADDYFENQENEQYLEDNNIGYDYYGNIVFVGDQVRIGADEFGEYFATGTVTAINDTGMVVNFDAVFENDGIADYYFAEGLLDEIENYGSASANVGNYEVLLLN